MGMVHRTHKKIKTIRRKEPKKMRRVKSAPANLAAMAHRRQTPPPLSETPLALLPLQNETITTTDDDFRDPPLSVQNYTRTLLRAEVANAFDETTATIVPEYVHFPLSQVVSRLVCDADECEVELDVRHLVRLFVQFVMTLVFHQMTHWLVMQVERAHALPPPT